MVYKRQNDEKALVFLKASVYCAKKERTAKYAILFLSVLICLVGIFNKYYQFLERINFIKLQENPAQNISLWLVVFSGAILIIQSFLLIRANRFGIEKTNLIEMFDNYIYNIPSNSLLMRPISPVIIENYAKKIKNKKGKYNNHYFKTEDTAEKKNAIFENQFKQFMNEYKLLLYSRGFFQTIWTMFFIGIIAISVNFNDTFVSTLVNILIPSLSIILIIVKSWHSLNEQIKFLHNCTSLLEKMREEGHENLISLNSRATLRHVQDAVFKCREADFIIPNFLSKTFAKKENKSFYIKPQTKAAQEPKHAQNKTVLKPPATAATKKPAAKTAATATVKKPAATAVKKPALKPIAAKPKTNTTASKNSNKK